MKQRYVKPKMVAETFVANEYVAACTETIYTYTVSSCECGALNGKAISGSSSVFGGVVAEPQNKEWGIHYGKKTNPNDLGQCKTAGCTDEWTLYHHAFTDPAHPNTPVACKVTPTSTTVPGAKNAS